MTINRHILVAEISVATFLQVTKPYRDKQKQSDPVSTKSSFTKLGEDSLHKHIWKCYVPTFILGKSREINSIEVTKLFENVRHIDDLHLIQHYKDMPHKEIEDIFITIVFCNHENNEITERLKNALFIKSITKPAAKNGSIDALKQETGFKKVLKKGEKMTDYIDRSGEHPFVLLLGVNTRTLKSFGGKKNEKK